MTSTHVLYRGPANLVTPPKGTAERVMARLVRPVGLWSGNVARGGRVIVTTQDVVFRPHPLNFCREIMQIPVHDVAGVSRQEQHAMRLVVLQLTDGYEVGFVSWQRDQLIDAIERARRAVRA